MKKSKFLLAIFLLILPAACALPTSISGPTVEPPVPASGTVLFQDDFSNFMSGWSRDVSVAGITDYDGGVYRFQIVAPRFNYWSTPVGKNFSDARIEVDVAKLGGPDSNRAGIICRLVNIDGQPHFYFFIISSDGYYAIGRTDSLSTVLLGQEQMLMSTNIKTGMAVNHLRADCAGNNLAFYINGFLVAQVSDSALTNGEAGLLAGAADEGGVDVIFDQFIVMQP